jgi:two-component system, sensor histidine kinase YesM
MKILSKYPLIYKIILSYLFTIIVPIIIFITFTFNYFQKELNKNIYIYSQKVQKQILNNIEEEIKYVESAASSISYNNEIKAAFTNPGNINNLINYSNNNYLKAYIDSVKAFRRNSPFYIYLLTNGDVDLINNDLFYNENPFTLYDWYRSFKNSEDFSTWIFRKNLLYFQSDSTSIKDHCFTYIKKIHSLTGDYIGAVSISIPITSIFSPYIDTNYVNEGVYISTLNNDKIFSRNIIDLDYDLILKLKSEKSDNFFLYKNGNIYLYNSLKALNVFIVSKVNIKKFLLPLFYNNLLFIVILILGSLVLIKILSIVLKDMYNKLQFITDVMNEVSTGNFLIQLPVNNFDEIDQVSLTFNRLIKKINELIRDIIEKERAQKNALLKALQFQINPHFIYNTIDVFRMKFILAKDFQTAEVLTDFGKMLRYNMSNQSIYSTIKDEADYVSKYINIIKLKYGNRINFHVNIDESLLDFKILKFILQPIIENSIKHGFTNMDMILDITLTAYKEGEKVFFEIQDNGPGIGEEQLKTINQRISNLQSFNNEVYTEGNIGLSNIYNRLSLYYGGGSYIKLKSNQGSSTCTTLCIDMLANSNRRD